MKIDDKLALNLFHVDKKLILQLTRRNVISASQDLHYIALLRTINWKK